MDRLVLLFREGALALLPVPIDPSTREGDGVLAGLRRAPTR
jgi:hypothetical protein